MNLKLWKEPQKLWKWTQKLWKELESSEYQPKTAQKAFSKVFAERQKVAPKDKAHVSTPFKEQQKDSFKQDPF